MYNRYGIFYGETCFYIHIKAKEISVRFARHKKSSSLKTVLRVILLYIMHYVCISISYETNKYLMIILIHIK